MVAERDFDVMNRAEIRKAAKELGVRQNGVSVAELKDACKRAAADVGKERAGRDFDVLNQAELRKAAKELGVRQKGVSVAGLKNACKCAAVAVVLNQAELRKAAKELGVRRNGVSVAELKDACKRAAAGVGKERAGRDFDAMIRAELMKVAKELGVRYWNVSFIELKDACKRAVWEARGQMTLNAWMAGEAHVDESAAAPLDTNLEDSGAGAVLGTVRQALPAAPICGECGKVLG